MEEIKCCMYVAYRILHPTKNDVEFPRGFQDRATPGGISMGLGFSPWNFQGCHTILQNLQW